MDQSGSQIGQILSYSEDGVDLTCATSYGLGLAISGDGRPIRLYACSDVNAGRHGIYEKAVNSKAPLNGETCDETKGYWQDSTTINDVLHSNSIEKASLLKLDCEGCEYAVLPQMSDALKGS